MVVDVLPRHCKPLPWPLATANFSLGNDQVARSGLPHDLESQSDSMTPVASQPQARLFLGGRQLPENVRDVFTAVAVRV